MQVTAATLSTPLFDVNIAHHWSDSWPRANDVTRLIAGVEWLVPAADSQSHKNKWCTISIYFRELTGNLGTSLPKLGSRLLLYDNERPSLQNFKQIQLPAINFFRQTCTNPESTRYLIINRGVLYMMIGVSVCINRTKMHPEFTQIRFHL